MYPTLKILLLTAVLFMCSCSLVEVKKDYYKRDLPKLPQKEQITIDDVGAISVGATEINKGLNELYYFFDSADNIEDAQFVQKAKVLTPKLKVLLDFSYMTLGFLGVAWDSINWDDPDAWLEQVETNKKAMQATLKNEKARSLKLEGDVNKLIMNLAEKEKAVKSREDELAANNGRWTAKFSFWIKFLIGVLLFVGLLGLAGKAYSTVVGMTAGLPLKAAFWGTRTVAKATRQLVEGIQAGRVELQKELNNGSSPEEKVALQKAMDILSKNLADKRNDEVGKLIKDIKKKHNFKSVKDV